MKTATVRTPLGIARMRGDKDGISLLRLETDTDQEISPEIPQELALCATELQAYFDGGLREFSFPLNPQGTAFQKRVWKELLQIPYGKTVSYLELAQKTGDPKAVRAVAAANAKNPVWIAIPCHRVIGSDGSLTGYAGGIRRKEWLLTHEGAIRQQSLF